MSPGWGARFSFKYDIIPDVNERDGIFSRDTHLRSLKTAVLTVVVVSTLNAVLQPPLTEYREHQVANMSTIDCGLNLPNEMNMVVKAKDSVCSPKIKFPQPVNK